jgi:hypothetical protein
MGPEDLKEMGIATVGQRLAILKAVYLIKLDHNVPFEPDHYIPPCSSSFSRTCYLSFTELRKAEVDDPQENLTVDRLYNIIREQG